VIHGPVGNLSGSRHSYLGRAWDKKIQKLSLKNFVRPGRDTAGLRLFYTTFYSYLLIVLKSAPGLWTHRAGKRFQI